MVRQGEIRAKSDSKQAILSKICQAYESFQEQDQQGPLYRKLYLAVKDLIRQGELLPHSKLPTLTKLAQALSLSKGTITHAYTLLQNEGLVNLTQGRGSFVAAPSKGQSSISRKDQAMEAIDQLLFSLSELNFSRQEIQIFLDLKMREFYEEGAGLKIANISSCLEEQNLIQNELSRLVQADFFNYTFDNFLAGQVNLQDYDLIVCSEDIYYPLRMRADMGLESKVLPLCFTLEASSLIGLAKLPSDKACGILAFSKNFSDRMQEDFYTYAGPNTMEVFELFIDEKLEDFLDRCQVLVFAMANLEYLNQKQRAGLENFLKRGGQLLNYRLQGERSSLLGIRMTLEDIADSRKE